MPQSCKLLGHQWPVAVKGVINWKYFILHMFPIMKIFYITYAPKSCMLNISFLQFSCCFTQFYVHRNVEHVSEVEHISEK